MKVLMLTDKLISGGAESYFCKLENTLAHSNLILYTAAAPGDLVSKLKHKKNYVQLSRKNHLDNLQKVIRIVRKQKIDLFHVNSLRMALYAILIKKLTRKKMKIIYTKHNVTVLDSKGSLLAKLINKYVDLVIAVSEFEKERLVSNGVERNKIRTIYNGVDLNQFTFFKKEENENFNVGILARLSEEKNHQFFLQVADKLKEIPNITFHIAGDGPESKNIANMITSLGISHKVKMRGNVQEPEQFIKEMDLLLLTSHLEVFPMVILEAMAVGTPIVSIDRGGIKEAILNEETGFLIADHSVEDFCNKILFALENREEVERIAKRARDRVGSNFSLEKMVTSTLDEYLKCI